MLEIIPVKTYEDALSEIRKRKATPDGAGLCYKIVKSNYSGYEIVAIEPELLADMLIGDIPAIPQVKTMMQPRDYSA